MMDLGQVQRYLESPEAAADWLRGLGVRDLRRGHASLRGIAAAGVPVDLLAVMFDQLSCRLPQCADADMALNNLDRFVAAARNPLAIGTLFERDPEALPVLLQIFSTSQYLSDLLIVDPEGFDLLRLTEGQPVSRQALVDELVAEVQALEHEQTVLRALRRFKRRETLRIAYGDIIREQSLATVTAQISYLADAIVEAALRAAYRKLTQQRGTPRTADGQQARLVVLGLGKLGGLELNYSSDIDLVLFYDGDGRTDGPRSTSNTEFFEHLARELVRLLTESTELGAAYRVDLRLRPEGRHGPMVASVQSALAYYDLRGRTWERQAYIKARPVAGDLSLGQQFLQRLASWIYPRYLSAADIAGIKALRRRIEQQGRHAGQSDRNVKTGRGGIRDIEFAIQFLQLLNGAELPQLRTGNTLEAIARLGQAGCLTDQERAILESNYSFLRKVEHRLQIMFDLQTHTLPQDPDELAKLALRLGYTESDRQTARERFVADYCHRTALNRRILNHLLHNAFSDDVQAEPEVDLVLDPDPSPQQIAEVLGKYRFRDVQQAYRNLMALAEEKLRFLSTRRCRHFLAAIAPRLLQAIANTADPDATLVSLCQVSDSLGGKGVLWELFSFNPPSLHLYVEICAYSPYLSGMLVSNPGMIDSLMDSLVLDKLPARQWLQESLTELCRGAEDLDPILHSFKNDQHLRIGVRDLLGKEDVEQVIGALSDVAETCLEQIAAREFENLVAKFGCPTVADGPRAGQPCEFVILGMGKLGGRELNYHSDLDVVFLYEAEGNTVPPPFSPKVHSTTNSHFFSQLGQRIIRACGRVGPSGRLYEIDARLRPTGRSGALATSLAEFERYFRSGEAQLWERQALCKARVVYGSQRIAQEASEAIRRAMFCTRWQPQQLDQIRQMRHRLEQTAAAAGDLKRGPGGIVDIEFLVQTLQLKYAADNPALRTPNTLAGLAELYRAGHLTADDYDYFYYAYRLLRIIEGRLGLLNASARDRLPQDPTELAKLAHLLRYSDAELLLEDFESATRQIRQRFQRIFDAESMT